MSKNNNRIKLIQCLAIKKTISFFEAIKQYRRSRQKVDAYLIGTLYGGLMEMPDLYFQPPYLIIKAKTEAKAIAKYNKKTKAYYFYGAVIAYVSDGKLIEVNENISREEAKKIYNEIISKSNGKERI